MFTSYIQPPLPLPPHPRDPATRLSPRQTDPQALSLRGCDQLTDLPLGSRLASLTSLEVRACPALFSLAGQQPAAAAQHAALINFVEWAAGRLPGLGELSNLESLDLSRSSTLRRLPAGVAHLSRLTRLAADGCRLDDCEGAAAGGALAPLLGCGALEALSLRGVTGVPAEAALPAGIGNLSRLQVCKGTAPYQCRRHHCRCSCCGCCCSCCCCC
jgi:Leucine-rich repeat (LRR) protein